MKDNPAKNQFEATIDGHTAVIEYKLRPGVMTVLHTDVPEEIGGRGIAAKMTRHVLEHIEANQLQVIPLCPYMRSYLKKHPQYQHLVRGKEDKSEGINQ